MLKISIAADHRTLFTLFSAGSCYLKRRPTAVFLSAAAAAAAAAGLRLHTAAVAATCGKLEVEI